MSKHSAYWPSLKCQSSNVASGKYGPGTVDLEERRDIVYHASVVMSEWELVNRYSSWEKLLRVTAYNFRFVRNLKIRIAKKESTTSTSVADIEQARSFWIRYVQFHAFTEEIHALKQSREIATGSSLRALNPFLDGEGVLRLGGRLRHAYLSFNEKFYAVLSRHHISHLIIAQSHLQKLHGDTQLTLRLLQQRYWIIGARSLVRHFTNRCAICTRERANSEKKMMGALHLQLV